MYSFHKVKYLIQDSRFYDLCNDKIYACFAILDIQYGIQYNFVEHYETVMTLTCGFRWNHDCINALILMDQIVPTSISLLFIESATWVSVGGLP